MNQRAPKQKPENQNDEGAESAVRYCGIVMPISPMLPEYDAAHWSRVKEVLSDAITTAGFIPRLVSESEEVGVIHGQIVQNLYDDEIVVCDVSGKNPNVMFELGLRLAFDKPTIIVQDDSNGYSFDIGPIKHIGYRRDQRFDDVQDFKEKVKVAILATVAKKEADENFSPFLKHFGHFTPKKVENQEVPQAEFIMKKLSLIENTLRQSMIYSASAASPTFLEKLANSTNSFSRNSITDTDELRLVQDLEKTIRHTFRSSGFRDDNVSRVLKDKIREQILHSGADIKVSDERFRELFDHAWYSTTKQDALS